jgi:beta-phosphoglucomutase-like phosphatase (HAD superfamily)
MIVLQKIMSLTLPPGNFQAYLFDCDGTIADTMPLHHKAWLKALSEWNCDFPKDLFYAWAGIPIIKTVEMLNEKFSLSIPPQEAARRREEAYFEFLPTIQAIADVEHHIHLQYNRIPMAVVSGSPKRSVIKTLEVLGLIDRFQAIVAEGDYQNGKPHPEPFLLAAKLLNVSPENCLVFEDAELGIKSAKAAGMQWVRVPQGPRF